MNFGDFMGLVAVVTGIISIFAILSGLYKRNLAFQERKLEILAGQTVEKAAQYAAHSSELEARVRVLERIATERSDGNLDLASQIDALRDLPNSLPNRLPHGKAITQ